MKYANVGEEDGGVLAMRAGLSGLEESLRRTGPQRSPKITDINEQSSVQSTRRREFLFRECRQTFKAGQSTLRTGDLELSIKSGRDTSMSHDS